MRTLKINMIILVSLLSLTLLFSLFTVTEGQQAILLQLDKIVVNPKTGRAIIFMPGLHIRVPFLQVVRKFDTRLQTLDIQSSRIVTAEKKDVIVDCYVKWRIRDLPLYFTRTSGDSQEAEILLGQQINDSLRAEFGKRTIAEVIADDRASIMDSLNKQANAKAHSLGLDIIDVRVKRIDLPSEVSAAVYERMRAERERVASEHRAQGKAKAEAIRANADASVTITVATAKADAARIRGEGDAEAAKISSEAYSRDPSFYAFFKSINAYKQVFDDKNDVLVLKPDSQFFKYFNNPQEQAPSR